MTTDAVQAVEQAPEVPAESAGSKVSLTLAGGYGGAVALPSFAGDLVGRAWIGFGAVGVHLAAREGVASTDTRTLGGLFAGLHVFLPGPLYARAGFAHYHETAWAQFTDDPFASFAGVATDIVHRSGFEAGAGVDVPLPPTSPIPGLGFLVDGSATVLPDSQGSPVYGWLELGLTLHPIRTAADRAVDGL